MYRSRFGTGFALNKIEEGLIIYNHTFILLIFLTKKKLRRL